MKPVLNAQALMTLVFVLAIGGPVCADETAPDLSRVQQALLREVRITDSAGYKRTGILESIQGDKLRILTGDGPVLIDTATIRRVERRGDSPWNGAAIGAGVGALMSVLAMQGLDDADGWPPVLVMSSLIYGVIGAGFDGLYNGWTRVVEKPAAADDGR